MKWRKNKTLFFIKRDSVDESTLNVRAMYDPEQHLIQFGVEVLGGSFGAGRVMVGTVPMSDLNKHTWRYQLLRKIISTVVFLYRECAKQYDLSVFIAPQDVVAGIYPDVPFIHDITEDDFATSKWS